MLPKLATNSLKVEHHANENPLKNSEKIKKFGQWLMYPNKKIP